MTEWIPVIVAVLTTVSAILSFLGKQRASGAVDILTDAIRKGDLGDTVKDLVKSTQSAKIKKVIDASIERTSDE